MNTQTKNKVVGTTKTIDLPKSLNQNIFAKWILVENKLVYIWCDENQITTV